MIKKNIIRSFLGMILLMCSCSNMMPSKTIIIGIDPLFINSPVGNKQNLVYAYTIELFEEIFNSSRYYIKYKELNFSNIKENIDSKSVDVAISAMPINIETSEIYLFSSIFLPLGDVFITRKDAPANFSKFNGKIIAINQNPSLLELFGPYPSINITYYTSIIQTLQNIADYSIDGAIFPYLLISPHFSPEYDDILIIHDKKLTDAGLKVITLKKEHRNIITHINSKVYKLTKNGSIEKLKKKWNLI